ncbi:hypothetical protein THIOSC13_460013 [uncultured Thiomicrorhabdus sp.]
MEFNQKLINIYIKNSWVFNRFHLLSSCANIKRMEVVSDYDNLTILLPR